MATYLIGEGKTNPDSRARMPGLCDYRDRVATFNLVEYTFDIDVRRWQRREFLTPNTTFLILWRTDEGKCCSLRVRVISEDQVRLIYSVRMPGKRWQRKEQPIGIVWDSCRYGGAAPLAALSGMRAKDRGFVLGRC